MLRLSSNTLNLSLKCSYTKLNKVLWVEPVSIKKHRLSEEIISGKLVPNVKENFISLFAFQLSLRALATYHDTAIPKIKITTEPIGPSFACAKAEGIPAAMTKNVMIKHPVFPFFPLSLLLILQRFNIGYFVIFLHLYQYGAYYICYERCLFYYRIWLAALFNISIQ